MRFSDKTSSTVVRTLSRTLHAKWRIRSRMTGVSLSRKMSEFRCRNRTMARKTRRKTIIRLKLRRSSNSFRMTLCTWRLHRPKMRKKTLKLTTLASGRWISLKIMLAMSCCKEAISNSQHRQVLEDSRQQEHHSEIHSSTVDRDRQLKKVLTSNQAASHRVLRPTTT